MVHMYRFRKQLAPGVVAWIVGVIGGSSVVYAQNPSAVKELRDRVVSASSAESKAKAYRILFEKVGRSGLVTLAKDEDTGLALQAAWESHKKLVHPPKLVLGRVDAIYDVSDLTQFLAVLKKRTKAWIPEWWAKRIVAVDVFADRHHAFVQDSDDKKPDRRQSKAGPLVPADAELEESGDHLLYTNRDGKLKYLKSEESLLFDGRCAGLIGEKRSAVAIFGNSGRAFTLSGYERGHEKPSWTVDVWGSGRSRAVTGVNDHWAELIGLDNMVFVFGGESHGMYLEAFDTATGQCRFRFCTCYWFNFSERWNLM